MQNSSLEVCLIGLAPGENAIARKSRLARLTSVLYAQKKKIARVERTRLRLGLLHTMLHSRPLCTL